MSESSCPACGAKVVFKIATSIITVCPYCQSVVARGDQSLADLGKVAVVTESGSALRLGFNGHYRKHRFTIVGRAQLHHQAGGGWDEWYAAFDDGRWGWLAEAQGHFYLTFASAFSQKMTLNDCGVGQHLAYDQIDFTIQEIGTATAVAGEGEMPYRLVPNGTYAYADLSAANGVFATLDFSEESPLLFTGREVTAAEIGLPAGPARAATRVSAVQLNCPKCGAPLALAAPDTAQRVTCPSCRSLLDTGDGKLHYLKALEPAKEPAHLPLGAIGTIGGIKFTLIGYLVRSVTADGTRYPWREYLLYEPTTGYRWLIESNGHFNFAEPIAVGDVKDGESRQPTYHKTTFDAFSTGEARVDELSGEFYWQVNVGEKVAADDFIAPPLMLSRETTKTEINWTLSRYVPVVEVKKAFSVSDLATPEGVGANQPYPGKGVSRIFWLLLVLACLVYGACSFYLSATAPAGVVFDTVYQIKANEEPGTAFFSEPITLAAANVEITATAKLDNTWVSIDGDVIDESTGEIRTFSLPIEYYSGVDDGEAWTEGSQSATTYLSAAPAGRYTVRLEAQKEKVSQSAEVHIVMRQGVTHFGRFALLLLALTIGPLLSFWAKRRFEAARWSTSDYDE